MEKCAAGRLRILTIQILMKNFRVMTALLFAQIALSLYQGALGALLVRPVLNAHQMLSQ